MPKHSCRTQLEPLEIRRLLSAALVGSGLPNLTVAENTAANPVSTYIPLTNYFANTTADPNAQKVVRFETNQGFFDMTMRADVAPKTVANFLNYVNSGRYNDSVIHRLVKGVAVQGGVYNKTNLQPIQQDAPIDNEFNLSNTTGTVAMWETTPNSATDDWLINLGDNSSTLDKQAGGLTVFATVDAAAMSGTGTIATINNDPTFQINNTNFDSIPLINYSGSSTNPVPVQPSNLVVVSNASVVNGLIYDKTVTNPPSARNLVTATVVDGALNLSYAPYEQGTAQITVTAKDPNDPNGSAVPSTFDITVGNAADVTLGAGGMKSVTFVDGDGTKSTISLKGPGSATLHFTSIDDTPDETAVTQTDTKAGAVMGGRGLALAAVSLKDTTAASSLTFGARGGSDGVITLGTITSTSAMGTIAGKSVKLVGSANLLAGPVKEIDLASASGASISTGPSPDKKNLGLTLNIGSAVDTSLTAENGIKSLKSGSWTISSTASTSTIKSTAIANMTVNGDLASSIEVPGGNILNAKITGSLTGQVSVANVGSMQVGTLATIVGITGVASSIKAGTITGSTIIVDGLVATVTAKPVPAIGTITAKTITGSTIDAVTGIGSISATTITGSNVVSGNSAVALPITLPTDKSQFNVKAVGIAAVNSKFFSSSQIIAPNFGKISLGKVTTSNGGILFGIGADLINSLSCTTDGGQVVKLSKLNPTFTPPASGDFRIALV